jgi:hypothetical protein
VSFEGNVIHITDGVAGEKPKLIFVLGQNATPSIDGKHAHINAPGAVLDLTSQGISTWRIEPREYSKRFGSKVPTACLAADIVERQANTMIKLEKE